ncbi:MAG: polysaccharide deacetylase family protein [Candidatus Kryptoniota bacterium]
MLLVRLVVSLGIVFVLLYLPAAAIVIKFLRRSQSALLGEMSHGVCLTFDDGPDPGSTPEILEILEKQKVHATFFILGENAQKYPDLVFAIKKAGHEIGLHGYSHLHPWVTTPWRYMRDLIIANRLLDRLVGLQLHSLYRPTYGKANMATLLFAWLFRKSLVFWNLDLHDYKALCESEIVANLLGELPRNRGAIVALLHDGRTSNWNRWSARTAGALATICGELNKRGYQFKTISEMTRSKVE